MYTIYFFLYKIFGLPQTLVIIRKIIFSLKSCPLLLVFYGSTFHMKQRWHCCQSCIRRTCGPQNRPLRTDLKQTEATLLLLWSWNSSIMGPKTFWSRIRICLTPMITYRINITGCQKLACKDGSFAQSLVIFCKLDGNFQNGLQLAYSNSNNWGRSVIQNWNSDNS